MNFGRNLIFGLMLLAYGCSNYQETQRGNTAQADNAVIIQMFALDQAMRQDPLGNWEETDQRHRQKVMQILAAGQLKTPHDKLRAALIMQHTPLMFCNGKLKSTSPENYLLASMLAQSALDAGLTEAAYMVAAATDRYLLYTQGQQKFGTQRIIDDNGTTELWAPIDTTTSDTERAKYGVLPLAELLQQYPMQKVPAEIQHKE